MSNKTQVDITTAKHYRLILRILFCIVDFAIPIVLIGMKYKLFTKFNGIKLTLIGIILTWISSHKCRAKTNFINQDGKYLYELPKRFQKYHVFLELLIMTEMYAKTSITTYLSFFFLKKKFHYVSVNTLLTPTRQKANLLFLLESMTDL